MPRTLLDWLGVVTLWIGALIMAIKAGDLPAPAGAPSFLSSDLWAFGPIALVTAALLIFIFRLIRPAASRGAITSMSDAHAASASPQNPYWTHKRIDEVLSLFGVLLFILVLGWGFMQFVKLASDTSERRLDNEARRAATSPASVPPKTGP